MSLNVLMGRFSELVQQRDAGVPLGSPWQAFCDAVNSYPIPAHLYQLWEQLEAFRGSRPRETIAILDHGCGAGFSILYLFCRGYRKVFGVTYGFEEQPLWNRLFKEECGIYEKRLHTYTGERLPIQSESIDFIFSQQVLEHVRPQVLNSYFLEEVRVLRAGGRVFHEVPHRLGPYDSHSRIWLAHYFPWLVRRLLYRFVGLSSDIIARQEERVHLRWPWQIKTSLRKHFRNVQDITLRSFLESPSPERFDGPSGIRRLVQWGMQTPILGSVARALLGKLVMLRLTADKK